MKDNNRCPISEWCRTSSIFELCGAIFSDRSDGALVRFIDYFLQSGRYSVAEYNSTTLQTL